MLPLPQRLPAPLRTISSLPDLHLRLQSMVCAYRGAPTSPALRAPPGENRTDGRCAQKNARVSKNNGRVFSQSSPFPHFATPPCFVRARLRFTTSAEQNALGRRLAPLTEYSV